MYHKHFVRAIFKDHSQDKDFAMVFGTAVNEGLDRYLSESTDEVVLTTYTTTEGHFVYESELHADALEKDADKFSQVMAKIFPKKDFEIEFSGV
tara:strand:- start:248 stop:529 length:282 start_codon:yes stop_codon:yes gene_type:complete